MRLGKSLRKIFRTIFCRGDWIGRTCPPWPLEDFKIDRLPKLEGAGLIS